MSPSSFISNKSVLVLGLGKSGIAATQFLHRQKAHITVSDIQVESHLKEAISQIKGMYHASEFGRHNIKDFSEYDYVVMSPGIRDDRILKLLEKFADKVIPEVELGLRHYPHRVIAITGTNGKTTTGTITQELLSQMGVKSFFAGNNGVTLCRYLVDNPKTIETTAIVEMSSYMLQWCKDIHPKIGVVMNVSPHHIKEHAKSFDNYLDAKVNLARMLDEDCTLVYNALDPHLPKFKAANKGQMAYFSKRPLKQHVKDNLTLKLIHCTEKNILHIHTGKQGKYLTRNIKDYPLIGFHNLDNLMAALQAAYCLEPNRFLEMVDTFDLSKIKAPEFRLQRVYNKDKIEIYNDAKSTNLMSTIRALEALSTPLILICGGQETDEDFHSLIPYMRKKVKTLILMGQSKERLNRILGDEVETFLVGSLEEAVLLAYQKSHMGDKILFSPGFPSFDMFKNYTQRGQEFNKAVQKI